MARSEKKKVINSFAWKMAERLTSQGVTFMVSIILARILQPSEFGAVAMVQIFIVLANVFVSSGFSSSLIQKRDADDLDFSTIYYCTLVVSVILYVVLYVSAPYIATFYNMAELKTVIRVYALILILYSYNSVQNAWVSRQMIFKSFFIATSVGTVCSGVIGIVMAYTGFGIWALIAQTMSNVLINVVVMRSIVSWRPKLIFSWQRAKSLMSYGMNILGAHIIGTSCNELRQLIIGRIYSPADLAFFNRGKQFPDLFSHNIDTTLNSVLFPAMSNHSDNKAKIKLMTRRSIKTSSYLLFFLLGLLAIVAEPLVKILLTEKWLDCVPYIQLACIANMVGTVSTANIQAIKALGRADVAFRLEWYKKPVFVLLIILSANISVMAMAVSMPIYSIYAAVMNMSPNKRLLGYGIKEQLIDYAPAALLFVCMSLLSWPVVLLHLGSYLTILLQVAIAVIVYFGLSRVMSIEAYQYLRKTIGEYNFSHKPIWIK